MLNKPKNGIVRYPTGSAPMSFDGMSCQDDQKVMQAEDIYSSIETENFKIDSSENITFEFWLKNYPDQGLELVRLGQIASISSESKECLIDKNFTWHHFECKFV